MNYFLNGEIAEPPQELSFKGRIAWLSSIGEGIYQNRVVKTKNDRWLLTLYNNDLQDCRMFTTEELISHFEWIFDDCFKNEGAGFIEPILPALGLTYEETMENL